MFTGLVTDVGRVRRAAATADGGRDLAIATRYRGLAIGESVAVDGACLTVVRKGAGWFEVHVVATTLARTNFGRLRAGSRVNLERALRLGDRLGGHLVQGHVDGVGRVVRRALEGDALLLDLAVPKDVARVSIPLGSVTVDGVSLTVNRVVRRGIIQVSLIPHTRASTTLGDLAVGARVHLEGDLIGKYLQALGSRVRAGR